MSSEKILNQQCLQVENLGNLQPDAQGQGLCGEWWNCWVSSNAVEVKMQAGAIALKLIDALEDWMMCKISPLTSKWRPVDSWYSLSKYPLLLQAIAPQMKKSNILRVFCKFCQQWRSYDFKLSRPAYTEFSSFDYDLAIVVGSIVNLASLCFKRFRAECMLIERNSFRRAAAKGKPTQFTCYRGAFFEGIGVWDKMPPQIFPTSSPLRCRLSRCNSNPQI